MNEQEVPVGRLYFLWHPGTKDTFSGYGFTIQAGRQDHLVGLLMVDRPQRVDPAWLAQIEASFGGYALHVMTATGERGIACQMQIAPDSLAYLRGDLGEATIRQGFRQALGPLLQQPPKPRLKLRWNEDLRFWTSEFLEPNNPGVEENPRILRFPLGQMVATPGALEALAAAEETDIQLLARHVTGDWGDLDEEDKQENELSVDQGFRILSAYTLSTGAKVWIITEADRSVTTILLPSEY
jgi:hypothetical protein